MLSLSLSVSLLAHAVETVLFLVTNIRAHFHRFNCTEGGLNVSYVKFYSEFYIGHSAVKEHNHYVNVTAVTVLTLDNYRLSKYFLLVFLMCAENLFEIKRMTALNGPN